MQVGLLELKIDALFFVAMAVDCIFFLDMFLRLGKEFGNSGSGWLVGGLVVGRLVGWLAHVLKSFILGTH